MAFSGCSEQGLLFAVECVLLLVVASVEHRLPVRGHQYLRYGVPRAWAQLPRGTWNPFRPGMRPASAALAGAFLSPVPPRKLRFQCVEGWAPSLCATETSTWQYTHTQKDSLKQQSIKVTSKRMKLYRLPSYTKSNSR